MAETETSRLSAAEIYDRVTSGAEEELARPWHNLGFSAVGAGLSMGLSGLGVAVLQTASHSTAPWTYTAYPLGFLVVILGRMQLFTENTLFPVALVLSTRRHLAATARLWGIVLAGNLVGTLLFALLATTTPAVERWRPTLSALGNESGERGFSTLFWTAVVGGWLVALVGWLVTASTDTVGQVLLVVSLTFLVGVGHFTHSIAGSGEVLTALLRGDLSLSSYLTWLIAAVLGNAVGGVLIVALLNYGQVHVPGGDRDTS
ncbi:MAG: formate/nitrite transporter family protein [Streptomyces sp.]|uniref:formate/nitrite transporter family protein n=1 Tax=Streptomyces sp. TaxID=1931 RepID=UPI0025FC5C1C|nr:formate/nitrite transporter family protein [Streptomyces sp.]MBW8792179.1 formate/nitrite transporter family protein [Streptomyces sp.]